MQNYLLIRSRTFGSVDEGALFMFFEVRKELPPWYDLLSISNTGLP